MDKAEQHLSNMSTRTGAEKSRDTVFQLFTKNRKNFLSQTRRYRRFKLYIALNEMKKKIGVVTGAMHDTFFVPNFPF